jgi:hypothetical protein
MPPLYVMENVSPSRRMRLGCSNQPMPDGVPMRITEPFSSVVPLLKWAMVCDIVKIMSLGGTQAPVSCGPKTLYNVRAAFSPGVVLLHHLVIVLPREIQLVWIANGLVRHENRACRHTHSTPLTPPQSQCLSLTDRSKVVVAFSKAPLTRGELVLTRAHVVAACIPVRVRVSQKSCDKSAKRPCALPEHVVEGVCLRDIKGILANDHCELRLIVELVVLDSLGYWNDSRPGETRPRLDKEDRSRRERHICLDGMLLELYCQPSHGRVRTVEIGQAGGAG